MQRRKLTTIFFSIAFLFVSSIQLKAQTVTSSPFSRFGIGEYNNKIFGQSAALSGTHIALQNDTLLPLFINAANPASYTHLKRTTFEVGVNSIFNKFSTASSNAQSNNTMLDYITLGFPVGKRMGGCVGVMPLSNVGYTINNYTTVENIGTVKEVYTGDGGINQLFLGLAIAPFSKAITRYVGPNKAQQDTSEHRNYRKDLFVKRLLSSISIGGNANYHFGTINNASRVIYPSSVLYYNTAQTTQSVVRGWSGNFGLQMTVFTKDSIHYSWKDTVAASPTFGKTFHSIRRMKDPVSLGFGYTYSLNSSLKTSYTDFAYTFLYQANGISEYIRDTIQNLADVKAPLTLPAMHGIGFSLRKGPKLKVLVDLETQLWSGFRYINQGSQLKDMNRVSIGVEYIPKKTGIAKGERWKRTQFRMGAHYSDGNLSINNANVNEYGVSLGVGIPVSSNMYFFNTFNLSAEAGQIGTTGSNLVQQQYVRVKLGFTFNDRWFIKYKYD
jgi:hypothetical protein